MWPKQDKFLNWTNFDIFNFKMSQEETEESKRHLMKVIKLYNNIGDVDKILQEAQTEFDERVNLIKQSVMHKFKKRLFFLKREIDQDWAKIEQEEKDAIAKSDPETFDLATCKDLEKIFEKHLRKHV